MCGVLTVELNLFFACIRLTRTHFFGVLCLGGLRLLSHPLFVYSVLCALSLSLPLCVTFALCVSVIRYSVCLALCTVCSWSALCYSYSRPNRRSSVFHRSSIWSNVQITSLNRILYLQTNFGLSVSCVSVLCSFISFSLHSHYIFIAEIINFASFGVLYIQFLLWLCEIIRANLARVLIVRHFTWTVVWCGSFNSYYKSVVKWQIIMQNN